MKPHRIVLMVLVLAALPALGQQRPDFSGSWIVESVQAPQSPVGDGRRGMPGGGVPGRRGGDRQPPAGGGRGRSGFADVFEKGERVSITQTPHTLVLVREVDGQVARYPLDGSETSQANRDGAEVTSMTRWEGVALVTETSQAAPRGNMTFKTRQVRTLSTDGKTMTLTTSIETPRGPVTTTVTFVR